MPRRPSIGSIVKIPTGEGAFYPARVLEDPYIAVYDVRITEKKVALNEITNSPVLFIVAVWDTAMKNGRWPTLGQVPLSKNDIPIPLYFIQDIANPSHCRIMDHEGTERDATIEECESLEAAAVWSPEQVEERIDDHYAGRDNIHLVSMGLVRSGQVFTIIVDRGLDSEGYWRVSGRAHAQISPGDSLSLQPNSNMLLKVKKITVYAATGVAIPELPSLTTGVSGTLFIEGDISSKPQESRALYRVKSTGVI